jgi:hypothetical protein
MSNTSHADDGFQIISFSDWRKERLKSVTNYFEFIHVLKEIEYESKHWPDQGRIYVKVKGGVYKVLR